MKAYANAKGWKAALDSTTARLPADPSAAGLTDEQMNNIKNNNNTICALTMALVGDEVFEIVANCVTTEYLDGVAHVIMDKLKRPTQRWHLES